MLTIYTHSYSPFTKEFWKWVARMITKKYSGPQAVCDSLARGLSELNVTHALDPFFSKADTVVVLSGVQALRSAITKKRGGLVKKLVAGPNIVLTPNDNNKIMHDPAIDLVLVPSQWVKDYYRSVAPELNDKVKVWPAGVAEAKPSSRDGNMVIYAKDDAELSQQAEAVTNTHGYQSIIFEYGNFKRADYLSALKTAPAVIYISPSESQGLALQEAWAHDVPTFVHFTGSVKTAAFSWRDDKINAPYLSEYFGAFYKDQKELASLISHTDEYHPQNECQKILSDKASAEMLLTLINNK